MNTSLSLRHLWLSLVASLSVTPMFAFAASNSGTITVGSGELPPSGPCWWGYLGSTGSYSPTALTGGESVSDLYDISNSTCTSLFRSIIYISGFSSNPGQSWLTSVTCNGVEMTGGSTSSYSYNSGTAGWAWNTTSGWGFSSEVGSKLGCTIVHD